MTPESRIRVLFEEIIESDCTPEEVCRDCPELLPEVRRRWERLRRVEDQIEVLFPPLSFAGEHKGAATSDSDSIVPAIEGYEIQAVLGRGGMGVVYKARHLKLHRDVALKMLLAGPYASQHERVRFFREAEAIAGLQHPHIVQVHDVDEFEARPYFTMEFLDGGSLAQELAGTPQPAVRSAKLIATLATAVQFAHEHGIVHRDLKPGNILLTSDGTPKIGDFGLARRVDESPQLTMTGARLGTPSYMAPEQATGQSSAAGPSVDVYALGAILYEMLTGRPPFRAETAAETERQVIAQEAVPPSRLNASVPRDLETICLTCLRKEPQRRYASAAALAADVNRFLEGRPIHARRVGSAERMWRFSRRNPSTAALMVTGLVVLALALCGGLWLARQQADRREETARQVGAVEVVLDQAADLETQGRWPEARTALETLPSLLAKSVSAELHRRVQQARADVNMVGKLEDIRLGRSESTRTREGVSPEQSYAQAFESYGIPVPTLDAAEAARQLRGSAIRETLLAFLYDWLYLDSGANGDKLRAVLDQADEDAWRRELRKAMSKNDLAKLTMLATAPEAAAQPAVVLSNLGATLLHADYRGEPLAMLDEAYRRHPGDFWINYLLGQYWDNQRPQFAVGYFRAAVAIRPQSDQTHVMLGRALLDTGDAAGAIAAFRTAIALNPNSPVGTDLSRALGPNGGLEEGRAAWEKELERDPPDHHRWHGYAELCLFLGKEESYRRARKALLKRFGDTASDWIIAERTSLSCLLMPVAGDELRDAVELVALAVADGERRSEPGNPYLRFVQGLAAYRQGRFEQAITFLRESAEKLPNRAAPNLVLAMAHFQSGSANEARKTLALAVRTFNWSDSPAEYQADLGKVWASHVLRREAEVLILPNLTAFLRGAYQPQDNDERIALLATCQFQRLYGTAARLYADAFTADPTLADSLTAQCLRRLNERERPVDQIEAFNSVSRYLAARCAALAGFGRGADGPKLSAAEQARWRSQARAWLGAELAEWAKMLVSKSPADRDLAKTMLTRWQVDPDLAELREPAALDKLSADERKEWLALWNKVEAHLKERPHS
jgi:serine/threonine-protein kinase